MAILKARSQKVPETVDQFMEMHQTHGNGPWFDTRISLFKWYRCVCGVKFVAEDDGRGVVR